MTPPRVRLVKATDAQKRERDALTHCEWGQRLTVPQFVEREERLRAHPWARDVMTTWLCLADESASEHEQGGGALRSRLHPGRSGAAAKSKGVSSTASEILGSCETFRMQSILRANGVAELGDSYGVASVFVEPSLRGRGIAAAMMTELVKTLPSEPGRPHSTILFSDVGASLYERAGYVAAAGDDRVWAPLTTGRVNDDVDRVFGEADLAAELARTRPPESEKYVVWPTAGQLDWHLERERIYSELLGARRPSIHGARRGDSVVFWVGDLKNSKLMIQLLVAKSTEDAVSLIRSARRAAHEAGLREVRHWSQPTDPKWPDDEDGGRREERDGSLSMLAPLDARIDPHQWQVIPRALWV